MGQTLLNMAVHTLIMSQPEAGAGAFTDNCTALQQWLGMQGVETTYILL